MSQFWQQKDEFEIGLYCLHSRYYYKTIVIPANTVLQDYICALQIKKTTSLSILMLLLVKTTASKVKCIDICMP
jgi:hypothetical protein